ncbi:MAG: hypothetical protein ACPGUV_03295, partial [Polyangiales bacterium]
MPAQRRTGTLLLLALLLQMPAAATPRHAGPHLAAQVRAGAYVAAWQTLQPRMARAPQDPALRYLAGRLAEELGDVPRARRHYAALPATAPAPLQQLAAARRAALALHSGRCRQALQSARRLTATGGPAVQALWRARQAEAHACLGQHRQAQVLLRRLLQRPTPALDAFVLRWRLAQSLWRSGQHAAARRQLWSALLRQPTHPDARAALAQWQRMGGAWRRHARLQWASVLAARGRHARAWAVLAALRPWQSRGEGAAAAWVRGHRLVRRRQHVEAARSFRRALPGLPLRQQPATLVALAQAERHAGRARRARRTLATLGARFPSHLLAAAPGQARRLLQQSLAGAVSKVAHRWQQQARWHLAWLEHDMGRHDQALAQLEAFRRHAMSRMQRAQSWYWQGRWRGGAGDVEGAMRAYEAAQSVSPQHWYALWAGARLRALQAPPVLAGPASSARDGGPPPDGAAARMHPVQAPQTRAR